MGSPSLQAHHLLGCESLKRALDVSGQHVGQLALQLGSRPPPGLLFTQQRQHEQPLDATLFALSLPPQVLDTDLRHGT